MSDVLDEITPEILDAARDPERRLRAVEDAVILLLSDRMMLLKKQKANVNELAGDIEEVAAPILFSAQNRPD